MQSLFSQQEEQEDSFLTKWMELAKPAFHDVNNLHKDCELNKKADLCSKYSLINSLKNLRTFPWISERVQSGQLSLHAWYFDITTCTTTYWDNQYGFIDL
jgi:carbonic anhydrase